jgi:ABC-type glutathione transport system ATPase component
MTDDMRDGSAGDRKGQLPDALIELGEVTNEVTKRYAVGAAAAARPDQPERGRGEALAVMGPSGSGKSPSRRARSRRRGR